MKQILITSLITLFCTVAFAQGEEKKENVEPDAATIAIQTATSLVNLGVKTNNPLHLVTASQILIDNPTASFSVEEDSDNPDQEITEEKEFDSNLPLNPRTLLAKAEEMNPDAATSDLITSLSAKLPEKDPEPMRGAKYGRVYTTRTANAHSTYTFYVTYSGGYRASLSIVGDGDTDLDFYVYDSYGNLVGSDTDYSDEAYFYWIPRRDTKYKVRVVNRGNVYNVFRIITN